MTIEVFIDIPKGSRNKYEFDKEKNQIKLDRVLHTSVAYPADYGFLPNSLAEDGDPLDVLVITRYPTFPGCLIEARPIALLEMVDTGENDEKIIAVPEKDPYYSSWNDLADIPTPLKDEINHFFAIYKELEKNKKVEMKGWLGRAEAEARIKKFSK